MADKTVINKKISPVVIVFLGLLAAIAPLSTDMYLPALPAMTDNFNVSSSMVQLTLTGSLVGMAVGQLFAGSLSDIFGRKPPLIASMLIFSLATAGCFLSDSIYPFLCFRLLQGFFGGAGIVIARAVVRDIANGPELMKLFSMLMLVNGLAPVAAPVIGGQILRFFSWRGVFALLFIIAVGLTVGSLIFKETLKTTGKGGLKKSLIMYRILMRDTYFMGHCIMQCFAFAAFFAYIAGSSFLFQNVYHLSAQTYSYLFGINGTGLWLTGLLVSRLAGHAKDWKILRCALILAFAGSIVLFLGLFFQVSVVFIAVVLFVTVSTLSAMGASSFSLAMAAHGKAAGGAAALIGFFSLVSGGLMAPLVGIAGSYTAMPMAIILVLGEGGALVAFYKTIYPRHRSEA